MDLSIPTMKAICPALARYQSMSRQCQRCTRRLPPCNQVRGEIARWRSPSLSDLTRRARSETIKSMSLIRLPTVMLELEPEIDWHPVVGCCRYSCQQYCIGRWRLSGRPRQLRCQQRIVPPAPLVLLTRRRQFQWLRRRRHLRHCKRYPQRLSQL